MSRLTPPPRSGFLRLIEEHERRIRALEAGLRRLAGPTALALGGPGPPEPEPEPEPLKVDAPETDA